MTIEKIDNRRLIIAFSEEDMTNLSSLEHSHHILKGLITQEPSFFSQHSKLLVEILPEGKGCVIFITLIPNRKTIKRKIYKIKSTFGPFIFKFNTTENLIRVIERLWTQHIQTAKSHLIEYSNDYFLIIYCKGMPSSKLKSTLNEYGEFYGKGKLKKAQLDECGHSIIHNNAIPLIGKYFSPTK